MNSFKKFCFFLMAAAAYAQPHCPPQGWSIEVGGQYTWMSFSTPPTVSGSTGGVEGQITYQMPKSFFGELRSIYNIGSLSGTPHSDEQEWYTEFVGGYCFSYCSNWRFTPYLGAGLDLLWDDREAYSTVSKIDIDYRSYYAIFGIDLRYLWQNGYVAAQVDCDPIFHQYISMSGVSGAAWKMDQRVAWAARLPLGYRLTGNLFMELTPYYRFLPIGKSSELGEVQRDLNQWGGFLSFRYFL